MTNSLLQRRIWIALLIGAGLWITLNLFCVFFYQSPHSFSFMNRFMLPGPFFSEDRITIVPRWQMRIKANGRWSEWRNPEYENFHEYHKKTLSYHKLAQSSLDRTLGRDLSRKVYAEGAENILKYEEFITLLKYIQKEYSPPDADSVHVMYLIDSFVSGENRMSRDTSFQISCKLSVR